MIARLRSVVRRRPNAFALAAASGSLVALALWLRLGPIDPALLDLTDATSTTVVDRRGVPLYESLSGDGTRSQHLEARDLPPLLVEATMAAEDRRFRSHVGVDPIAIARAMRRNLVEGAIVEGGSTISQQVAKLLIGRRLPGRSRGTVEKIHEAVLALRLEHRFEKQEILALYLNLAAYGNQLVGVGRASRSYFGCDPSLLTPAQAAFLAGLPQRPSGYNPFRHPAAATARQQRVLGRMEASGALSPAQAAEARGEQLRLSSGTTPFLAPHFVEMVLASAGEVKPARIVTTLDAELQRDVVGIIRSHRAALERHGAANVAVVVFDNAGGEWLAWEGSGNYADAAHGGTINGAAVPRQPGSALKPFTYALAFESGVTPASVLADIPSHFPTAETGVLYSPRNYDGRYRGPLLARRALAGSENVPAVALAADLGVASLLRFLHRAGFSTFDRTPSYYGLGLTLGNAEVRLDEMVAAYGALARGGEWIEPTWASGDSRTRARRQLVSPGTAYWIADILADNEAREYIFGRGGSLEFPFPVAVKTGTSQAYHDNWTVGYTRDVTVGVWVGNFDRTPLRSSSGVTGAAPIFHAVMLAVTRRLHGSSTGADHAPIVAPPERLPEREVCALSGMPANAWCASRRRERLRDAGDPPCSWHHQSEEGVITIWPPEYRDWARSTGLLEDQRTPADNPSVHARASAAATARTPLAIANPPDGATYFIDPTLRREFQTLVLRVVVSAAGAIEWSLNGRPLATLSSDRTLDWPLSPGAHRFVVRDARGHRAESSVVVK